MGVRNLKEYFNCDSDPLSVGIYQGKHVGFFAVVDHINDGYAFAETLPLQRARGLDVFEGKPLPASVLFVYPEHTLVPRQQQQFVHRLITRYPEVGQIIILTTSAVILSDAVTCEILRSASA